MLFPNLRDLIKLKSLVNSSSRLVNRTGSRLQGDYTSLFHGLGVEFETVRPYVIGDDIRHIDWRVTAKFGKAHIKTFRAECDRNVFVITDINAYMRFGTRNTFKSVQAAHLTALLCWQALQQQDRVGGLVFGDIMRGVQYFKSVKGDKSVLQILKALCNQQINNHEPIAISTAINHLSQILTPQSLVFIISDFNNDTLINLEKSLLTLSKRSTVVLLSLYDRADMFIPAVGQIRCANGLEELLINTDDSTSRKRYQMLWENYYNGMQQMCRKIKVPLLWVETTTDLFKLIHTMDRTAWHKHSIAKEE